MMDEKVLSMKEYINEAEAALLHTYNRYQVVLEKNIWIFVPESPYSRWVIITGNTTML